MKCLVRETFGTAALVAALGTVVVAITGASAGAAYLILFGLLAIALAIRLGPEWLEGWREERGEDAREKP